MMPFMQQGEPRHWQEERFLAEYKKEAEDHQQQRKGNHPWPTVMVNAREFWGDLWEKVQGQKPENPVASPESPAEKAGITTRLVQRCRSILESLLGRGRRENH